ncbi:MAG TPA: hypothetical protein VES88_09890 [Gemmatimonadaceae bacterium]|nr:hypothetical protein [Gemmatimonadaceae bacterium]
MEHRIPASLLVRRLADVLNRVRYGGDTFIVERHHVTVARIGPAGDAARAPLQDAARAWMESGASDSSFAEDLERVSAADRPPRNPWDS